MSELVVVGFENVEEADRVLLRLEKLKKNTSWILRTRLLSFMMTKAGSISSKVFMSRLTAQRLVFFFFPAACGARW